MVSLHKHDGSRQQNWDGERWIEGGGMEQIPIDETAEISNSVNTDPLLLTLTDDVIVADVHHRWMYMNQSENPSKKKMLFILQNMRLNTSPPLHQI